MKKNLHISKSCPLCESKDTVFLIESYNMHGRYIIDKKDTFKIRRCKNCSLVFLSDIEINAQYYKKYYDTGYYDGGIKQAESILAKMVSKLEEWSLQQKESNLLEYAHQRKEKLKILDVGCGNGKFLGSLSVSKFKKYGIEINKEGIELSRKMGLTVYDKDITEIDFGTTKFDIVTMWHVQEHLIDPIGVFKKIHSILEEDGFFLSATPNTDSLGFKIGKEKWFHLDSPRHLMLFNKKSNQYLSDQTGFKIIEQIEEPYDFPLDLLWSVKDSAWKYLVYPTYPLAKLLDTEALIEIFRKK